MILSGMKIDHLCNPKTFQQQTTRRQLDGTAAWSLATQDCYTARELSWTKWLESEELRLSLPRRSVEHNSAQQLSVRLLTFWV
jgi:hypothetical protein